MTVEQLKNVHGAKPFRPFTVQLGDGRSFRVDHPEFLSRSQSGRTIVVHQPDESFSVLDLLWSPSSKFIRRLSHPAKLLHNGISLCSG